MAVGTTNFPGSLDDAVSLVEVKNNASTTLTSAINASALSIPIADPSEFPETGYATLTDSLTSPTKTEIFIYTSKSGSNLVVPSGGRGAQGTTANSFSSGHFVEMRPTAGHHEALRGALIAIETKLGTGADTAASGQVLIGNGSGTSEWRALAASDLPTGIDAAKVADGSVSNTEFQYINGVTSAIQTQLDGKAATSHNHAASDITSGTLALARGGTGADLSATGAGFLKQATTGAAVTVAALSSGDIPDLSATYATAGHNHTGTYQPLDSDLTAVAGLSTTGIIARTGSGTASVRTITGTTNRVTVTNGDGASGNPTLDIGTDVVTLTGTQTLTNKTLTSPSIAKLANLTSNGIVKTSGSDGTLSVATAGTDYASAGAVTGSGLTMATARILGRTTAGTGAVEEITVGSGLSLTGGELTATGSGGGDSISVNGSAVTDANFTSTPAAPAGGVNVIWQTSGSGPASVSGYLNAGSLPLALMRMPIYWTDFMNPPNLYGNTDMSGTAISSGTAGSTTVLDGNHPGVISISSSTTTNSGYRFNTNLGVIRLAGGERVDVVFRTPPNLTNTTIRFGFADTTTSAAPTDGVYFEIIGTAATGACTNNSTTTTSSTIATLSTNTWYHAVVLLNSNATQADFTLYSEAGSSLGTQSITTNIPTGSGREVGAMLIATNSGTTSVALIRVDYFSYAFTRALVRGL